jgi:hypothetical protein
MHEIYNPPITGAMATGAFTLIVFIRRIILMAGQAVLTITVVPIIDFVPVFHTHMAVDTFTGIVIFRCLPGMTGVTIVCVGGFLMVEINDRPIIHILVAEHTFTWIMLIDRFKLI